MGESLSHHCIPYILLRDYTPFRSGLQKDLTFGISQKASPSIPIPRLGNDQRSVLFLHKTGRKSSLGKRSIERCLWPGPHRWKVLSIYNNHKDYFNEPHRHSYLPHTYIYYLPTVHSLHTRPYSTHRREDWRSYLGTQPPTSLWVRVWCARDIDGCKEDILSEKICQGLLRTDGRCQQSPVLLLACQRPKKVLILHQL